MEGAVQGVAREGSGAAGCARFATPASRFSPGKRPKVRVSRTTAGRPALWPMPMPSRRSPSASAEAVRITRPSKPWCGPGQASRLLRPPEDTLEAVVCHNPIESPFAKNRRRTRQARNRISARPAWWWSQDIAAGRDRMGGEARGQASCAGPRSGPHLAAGLRAGPMSSCAAWPTRHVRAQFGGAAWPTRVTMRDGATRVRGEPRIVQYNRHP